MFGIEITPALVWIAVAVIFGIIEVLTLGILTVWFAIGAVFAAVAAILGMGFLGQFVVFLVSSIVLLYFTRPIAEKYLKIGEHKTNAESLIGEKAIIIQSFEKGQTGQAKVRGQVWSCEDIDGTESYQKGDEVIVVKIEGVRLLIKREDA